MTEKWTEDEKVLARFDDLMVAIYRPLNKYLDELHKGNYLSNEPTMLMLVLLGQSVNTYIDHDGVNFNSKKSLDMTIQDLSKNPVLSQIMLMGGIRRGGNDE